MYLASIIWQLQQQLLFSSLSRVCAQTYKGEGKWSKSSASPSSSRAFNSSSGTQTFYTVQPAAGFSPTRHFFPIICLGAAAAADILLKILRMSAWPRKAHFLAPVPFSCLQRCCPAHRSLSLFFFSFSTARHDFLTRFHEIFIHMSERLVSHQRYYKAKSKKSNSSTPPPYPIPYRCGSGIPDLH